jgi:hypothetical protein
MNASGGNGREFRHRRALPISAAETDSTPKAVSLVGTMRVGADGRLWPEHIDAGFCNAKCRDRLGKRDTRNGPNDTRFGPNFETIG